MRGLDRGPEKTTLFVLSTRDKVDTTSRPATYDEISFGR